MILYTIFYNAPRDKCLYFRARKYQANMSIVGKPSIGFEVIKFGMSREEVKKILGEPSDTFEESLDGEMDFTFEYEELGLELAFLEEDQHQLGLIVFYAPDTLLFDQEFIGLTEKEFLKLASEAGFEDLEKDDYDQQLTGYEYFSDEYGVSFWIEDGVVESISLLPESDMETGESIWPE